ncbi:hypothetical protein SASPL_129777 [Salvia splendens]|uniref:Uncharacterized protein n=1 Tax=Salvia splendens TaxID=180675 RepID=A0A8X8XGQ9_SALSN|nr:hypothetical protein SASPL_129777 [Salvia splendens]
MPQLSAGFDVAELFPLVKLFKWMSRLSKRIIALHKETDRILDDAIRQHGINKAEDDKDLLDVLFRVEEDGLDRPITSENIKAMLVVSFLSTLSVLQKAQEEVRMVFDEDGSVDESRIPQLNYLKAVVKETLRRVCPSMTFGLANVEFPPLALFLYHFDWNLMKPQDLDMDERFGFTASRLTDLFLVPVVKRPLPITNLKPL